MGNTNEGKNYTQDEIDAMFQGVYCQNKVPVLPTLEAIDGIKFDFCFGFRMKIPNLKPGETERQYIVEVFDMDTNSLIFRCEAKSGDWIFNKKVYYINYRIAIYDLLSNKLVYSHTMDLKGKNVVIKFPEPTVGDTIAWFSPCETFMKTHKCKLIVAMRPIFIPLFKDTYPDISFVSIDECQQINAYASYVMGVGFEDEDTYMPYDWRMIGLHAVGYLILGLDPQLRENIKPRIAYDKTKREINEPYVCISSMASGGCKLWLNPYGWTTVVDFLKQCKYRVADIDGNEITGKGIAYQRIPYNAENWTGKGIGKTLSDRASMIHHSDFHIGLGSGLSWLAWAVGKPVVLISGFSLPTCEFYTPYRIINFNVCHGCFSSLNHPFDAKEAFWCPRYEKISEKLICSLSITPEHVISAIIRIPEFQKHIKAHGISVFRNEQGNYQVKLNSKKSITDIPSEKPFIAEGIKIQNGNIIIE